MRWSASSATNSSQIGTLRTLPCFGSPNTRADGSQLRTTYSRSDSMCAASIANAVYNAIGVRIRSLPITPDKVLAAVAAKNKTSNRAAI